MKVIYDLGIVKIKKTSIAIGVFDGIHRGHQLLIKRAVLEARRIKAKSMVITFFPHPAQVLSKNKFFPYLMSLEDRLEMFKASGVDLVWVVRFNKQFSQIDPRYFIEKFLVAQLGVKSIYVGENFRFGRQRSGDVHLFKELSQELGYQIHAVKPLKYAKEVISSGRLRALIPQGKLSQASKLLGRAVSLSGEVVAGASRGKALGYPTANVQYRSDILPPCGVYAVRVQWKNKILFGMANLGFRPTFKEKDAKPLLEVHLFDFNQNIYGKKILVEFIRKIRNEKSFTSKDNLIVQIRKDEQVVRQLLPSIK